VRVLIAGCGYVGSALGRRLCDAECEVFGLRRTTVGLADGILPVAADLSESATLRAIPSRLDAVVYTAAADGFSEAAYNAAYVQGLRNLLHALAEQEQSPRRILFTSSTAVYGQNEGEWVDEMSPTEPQGFAGRCLLEGERLLLTCRYPSLVVRLGGVYGPGRTRLIESVRSGTARLREGPPRYTNRIHRDDCAGVLAHLLGLAAPKPMYLGVDCEPADEAVVLGWLAERLGVSPPQSGTGRGTPNGRSRGNKRATNDRLLASGYRFLFPTFREGYGALLQEREG
jgi:nucleoside-diphosphate-sugar epimerase